MKHKIGRSIGFKIIALYALLALINISFVISVIFENQADLIGAITKLESEKQLVTLIDSLKKFTLEMKKGRLFETAGNEFTLKQIAALIGPHVTDYVFFTEKGDVLYKSGDTINPPETFIEDGLRSITSMTFSGKEYYIRIDEAKEIIYCYIPLRAFDLSSAILLVRKDIHGASKSLKNLYFQAVYVLLVILFFHLIFALVLFRYIIHPLKLLNQAGKKLSEGDLTARVSIQRKDEFGSLADTFNGMAESIHANMTKLSNQIETEKEGPGKSDHTALRDRLTGLVGRAYMLERVQEEIKKAGKTGDLMAFFLIDIDNFQNINNVYGRQTGNIVLMETAKTILHTCMDTDIVARFGGEEFAVMSSGRTPAQVHNLAEEIRATVEKKNIITPDGEIPVTISIGVSYFDPASPNTTDGYYDISQSAETALLEAKLRGRNRVEISR